MVHVAFYDKFVEFVILVVGGILGVFVLAGYDNEPVGWAIWIALGVVILFLGFVIWDYAQEKRDEWSYEKKEREAIETAKLYFLETYKFESPETTEERAHVWLTYVKPELERRAELLDGVFHEHQSLIDARVNSRAMPANGEQALALWRNVKEVIERDKASFHNLAECLNRLGYLKDVVVGSGVSYKDFLPTNPTNARRGDADVAQ